MKLVNQVKNNLKLIITKHCTLSKVVSAPWIGTRMGVTISMDVEAVRLLHETVSVVMQKRPAFREKFTEDYMRERLIDILFSCHATTPPTLDNKLVRETKRHLRRMHSATESWVYVVPVVNLKLIGIKKLSIGEVDFYDLNGKTFQYLESKFSIRFGYQKKLNERRSELIKNNINVLAAVKVTAGETKKAENIALFKVESSLNILRLYDFGRDIGIQREFFEAFGREDIYWQNLRTRATGSSHGGPPPTRFFPYSVDKPKLSSMRKIGKLSRFSKLLKEMPSTKLNEKIAMSIHWYGLGVKDKMKVDRFVKLIVALESLLLRENDRLKKQLLADRAAFILGKDKDNRKNIYELVEQMYSLRGDIVHEGKHDISEGETLTLISLVRTLIFAMVNVSMRLQSLEDIDKRIKEIKFGSQIRGV